MSVFWRTICNWTMIWTALFVVLSIIHHGYSKMLSHTLPYLIGWVNSYDPLFVQLVAWLLLVGVLAVPSAFVINSKNKRSEK